MLDCGPCDWLVLPIRMVLFTTDQFGHKIAVNSWNNYYGLYKMFKKITRYVFRSSILWASNPVTAYFSDFVFRDAYIINIIIINYGDLPRLYNLLSSK